MEYFNEYKKQIIEETLHSDKVSFIISIKFEKIKDSYHMFSMMEDALFPYPISVKVSDLDTNKVLIDALNIVLPTKRENILEFEQSRRACIIDGKHLNIEMLQYLKDINNPNNKHKLVWNDIDIEGNSKYIDNITTAIRIKILQGWSL